MPNPVLLMILTLMGQQLAKPIVLPANPVGTPPPTPSPRRPTIGIGTITAVPRLPAKSIDKTPAVSLGYPANRPGAPTMKLSPAVATAIAREKSVKACLSDRGRFIVQIRGVGLTASGSDVDQIYGSIYARADTIPLGVIAAPMPGWGHATIWNSPESYNLGKHPIQGVGMAYGRGQPFDHGEGTSFTTIAVLFDLKDEDDARGGSDDEYFYVSRSATRYSENNGVSRSVQLPSCRDAPSFDRKLRFQVVGSPRGSASQNTIILTVEARLVRTSPTTPSS